MTTAITGEIRPPAPPCRQRQRQEAAVSWSSCAASGRLDRGAVWRLLRRLAKTAGIAVVMSPQALRHTYATLARDAGVPLDDVQDGLGHADPRTTRSYDHGGVRLDRAPGYTLARELSRA